MSKEAWAVVDAWAGLRLHWHGYVERVALARAATREQRLTTEPDEVMVNPDEVAAWLAGTSKAATSPAPIKGNTVADVRDFADSMTVWRSLASHGESVATGVRGQIVVAAEAVTERECGCQVSTPGPISRLNRGRRR